MRTDNYFQHSNWVLIALPHGNRECENPVQEKKRTKFAFKKEYLKQGETKDRRMGKFSGRALPLAKDIWIQGFQRHKSPQGNRKITSEWLTFYLYLLVTSTLLEYQFACRACAPCFIEGCPKRVKSGFYSLFSEEYFTASKSNNFLITLFTGRSSGRDCRLNSFGTSILLSDCCFLGWDTTARSDLVQSSFKGRSDQRSLGNVNGNELICLVGQKGTGCFLVIPCYFL